MSSQAQRLWILDADKAGKVHYMFGKYKITCDMQYLNILTTHIYFNDNNAAYMNDFFD